MEQWGDVWQAAEFIFVATKEWPQSGILSERELLEHALAFANTGSSKHVMALLGGIKPPVSAFLSPGTEQLFRKSGRSAQWATDKELIRVHLSAVAELKITTNLREFVAEHSSSILLIPDPVRSDERRVIHRVLPRNLVAVLAYALQLLLDETRPYWRKLCICKWHECEDFFFERPPEGGTGRPRRRYCSDPHMALAHDEGAAARRRVSRADKASIKQSQRRRRTA